MAGREEKMAVETEQKSALSREEQAAIEVGHTMITAVKAWLLSCMFLCAIFVVSVAQQLLDIREHFAGKRALAWPQCYEIFLNARGVARAFVTTKGSFCSRVYRANSVLLRMINEFEDELADKSLLKQLLIPPAQVVMTRTGGVGNENAYVGRREWLFYRPCIDYLTAPGFLDRRLLERRRKSGSEWVAAPQPDPRQAILQFKEKLSRRGIELVVVPTPVKPMIWPEQFSRRYVNSLISIQNESYGQFIQDLAREGVLVFDATELLFRDKLVTGRGNYLRTDTHWRPEAMELVAGKLADFIREKVSLPPAAPIDYSLEEINVTRFGDTASMLNLPKNQKIYEPETVRIRQVIMRGTDLWRPSQSADILFLGDSFSNVYSFDAMGWGEAAGLIEHLGRLLERPIDAIVRNDAGAYATREILSRELARGKDRLAGKRLVIWQFAMRELGMGDWKLLDMTLGKPSPSRFVVPESGAEMTVTGVIEAVSSSPKPGTVPYKDHIIAVHLVDVQSRDGAINGAQVLAYMWGMRDNVRTRAARFRVGDRISVRIQTWAGVATKYERINRTELENEALQLEEYCWAEEL